MKICVGYVPLTDAAPVIAAAELGFARDEGIAIELSPEPSWATLRDRLALDHLDAAHMLAPLAIASALGLSGPQADLVVPMALNLNGNAVTLSSARWGQLEPATPSIDGVASAFAAVAAERLRQGRPLTLGTVHPFSCHTYQLRVFAERGGLDLDRSVRLVVVPPQRTVDALRRGIIDGFCVGAPWNSIAVEAGLGRIAVTGSEIVPDCPEKVLAIHAAAPDDQVRPLLRAVHRAGIWCADTANHRELAELLANKGGIGPDAEIIRRTLTGELVREAGGATGQTGNYVRFGADVHRPRLAHASWIAGQISASGQAGALSDRRAEAEAVYRPDLFDAIS